MGDNLSNGQKLAVILFHKDSHKYSPKWIQKCLHSIKNQTFKNFTVFEMDYGGTHTQLYDGSSFASTTSIKNHSEAHNFLCDQAFSLGFEYVANVNLDDFYTLDRFEKQLVWLEEGYDVISSNFHHIDENGRVIAALSFDSKNPELEAKRGHNIIAHPVCAYSKNFWTNCTKLNPAEIPKDDFELWKRSYGKFKFKILPNFLLYYRVHKTKVSAAGQWKKH